MVSHQNASILARRVSCGRPCVCCDASLPSGRASLAAHSCSLITLFLLEEAMHGCDGLRSHDSGQELRRIVMCYTVQPQ